jgi:hypothetical protein
VRQDVVVVAAVRGAVPLSLLAVLCEPDIFAHSYVIFQFFSKFEILLDKTGSRSVQTPNQVSRAKMR